MTDKQWQELCHDISDRRGLKHEWNAIDDDVKLEIRKAWEEILNTPSQVKSFTEHWKKEK